MLVTITKFPSLERINSHYNLGDGVNYPIVIDCPVIVSIDPSKSDFAACIMRLSGEIVEVVELSGKGMDTTHFCYEFKEFLLSYLRNTQITLLSYESVIKRDDKKGSYISMVVLNEIQAHIKDMCIKRFGSLNKAIGINNWAWKAKVLPKEFNKKSEKGSYKFLVSIRPDWVDFNDNVTDSICIAYYTLQTHVPKPDSIFPAREEINQNVQIKLLSDKTLPKEYTKWIYNKDLSFMGNISYVKNRSSNVAIAEISNCLPIPAIYKIKADLEEHPDNFYLAVY